MQNEKPRTKRNVPVKTRLVGLRLTPEQYRLIEQRAEHCQVSPGLWMRSILMQAASQSSDDGYIRKIKEPDGALT